MGQEPCAKPYRNIKMANFRRHPAIRSVPSPEVAAWVPVGDWAGEEVERDFTSSAITVHGLRVHVKSDPLILEFYDLPCQCHIMEGKRPRIT